MWRGSLRQYSVSAPPPSPPCALDRAPPVRPRPAAEELVFGMEIKDVDMLKKIFEELDVTKDGFIDRNELKPALEKAVRASPPRSLTRDGASCAPRACAARFCPLGERAPSNRIAAGPLLVWSTRPRSTRISRWRRARRSSSAPPRPPVLPRRATRLGSCGSNHRGGGGTRRNGGRRSPEAQELGAGGAGPRRRSEVRLPPLAGRSTRTATTCWTSRSSRRPSSRRTRSEARGGRAREDGKRRRTNGGGAPRNPTHTTHRACAHTVQYTQSTGANAANRRRIAALSARYAIAGSVP